VVRIGNAAWSDGRVAAASVADARAQDSKALSTSTVCSSIVSWMSGNGDTRPEADVRLVTAGSRRQLAERATAGHRSG